MNVWVVVVGVLLFVAAAIVSTSPTWKLWKPHASRRARRRRSDGQPRAALARIRGAAERGRPPLGLRALPQRAKPGCEFGTVLADGLSGVVERRVEPVEATVRIDHAVRIERRDLDPPQAEVLAESEPRVF